LLGIASRFGSAAFVLPHDEVTRCRQHLAEAGIGTSSFLIYASSNAAFIRCDTLLADDLPSRLDLRRQRIDAVSADELVAQVQQLQIRCGLPALPGYFLRGRTQRNLTMALFDPAGTAVGMAIAMDESAAGPAYAGWYFPASVAVADGWKGKGLGRWLNAAVIDLARREGGAVHLQEAVSPANTTSRRMIESCGLTLEDGISAIVALAEAPPAAWRGDPQILEAAQPDHNPSELDQFKSGGRIDASRSLK
jgi:GNAT superfamily N-acetyltransferase